MNNTTAIKRLNQIKASLFDGNLQSFKTPILGLLFD